MENFKFVWTNPLLNLQGPGASWYFNAGTIFALLAILSVPLFGPSIEDILLVTAVVLLLVSPERKYVGFTLRGNPTALIAAVLFVWILVTVLWADAGFSDAFSRLKKYRELVFISLIMPFFLDATARRYGLMAIYVSLLISLVVSYLAYNGLVELRTGHHMSINHRIFNGISISFFAYLNLVLFDGKSKYRILYLLMYFACLYQIFIIENGRTGYLAMVFITLLFVILKWKLYGIIISVTMAILISLSIYFFGDDIPLRFLVTGEGFSGQDGAVSLQILQEKNNRIELLLFSSYLFMENWLFGTGIGDFTAGYAEQWASHVSFWGPSENAHNEFLMIATQTGIIGLALFCMFLLSIPLFARDVTDTMRRRLIYGVFVILFTTCLFNSSLMDHKDGTFFMVLIAVLLSENRKFRVDRARSTDTP